jgi:hypothetical protein
MRAAAGVYEVTCANGTRTQALLLDGEIALNWVQQVAGKQ